MKISILGTGRLAWHLVPALEKAGFFINEIYNRSLPAAEALASQTMQARIQTHTDFRDSRSHLFILSVKDDALAEIAQATLLPSGSWIVHTSGSKALEVLQNPDWEGVKTGVFYPLQSFSKDKAVDWKKIPIFLEATDPALQEALCQMAQGLSQSVRVLQSGQRQILHIAAVFANNFSNHMFRLAQEILEREGLDLSALYPLIEETVQKTIKIGPHEAQTGPALRQDQKVIDRHASYLEANFPAEMATLYRMLSKSIQNPVFNKKNQKDG